MSERIVNDPSLHGWVEENGKWVWEGGATTGHIEDGTIDGQTTTWDVAKTAWMPEPALTIDNSGNANFSGQLQVTGSLGNAYFADNGCDLRFSRSDANYVTATDDNGFLIFRTGGQNERLRIDNSGNARFASNIAVGSGSDFNSGPISSRGNGVASVWNDGVTRTRLARFENADTEAKRTSMTLWSDNNQGVVLQAGTNGGNLSLGTRTGGLDNINMTIDGKTGNVGVGTSDPSSAVTGASTVLQIGATSPNAAVLALESANGEWEIGSWEGSYAGGFGIFNGKRGDFDLNIDSTGNATFSGTVDASYSSMANGTFYNSYSDSSGISFASHGMDPTDNTGAVVSGTKDIGSISSKWKDAHFSGTVDAAGFTVNGAPIGGGGGLPNGDFTHNGTITATDFIATSDERAKDNITTAPTGILEQLHGREWDWKESGEKGSGVVAQELEQVLPHLVHEDDEGMKSVAYNGLVAYLIEEVKALRAEVEALK